jgi:hypothetical protein
LAPFLALLGCTDDPHVVWDPQDSLPTGDTTPPAIVHDAITTTQLYGQSVPMQATVTDDDAGVFVVQVHYRQETSSMWNDTTLMDMDGDTIFDGQIPGGDVLTGGMYYYVYAMDREENEATFPEGGENDPLHFRISPD